MTTKQIRGNQCIECEKTHEECAVSRCSKAEVSQYVCKIFGTWITRRGSRR